MYSPNTAKNLTHFTNFPGSCFWLVSKNTISRHPRTACSKTLENKFLYILLNLCKEFLLERGRRLLSGRVLNNIVNAALCLSLVKCSKIFHFN